LRRCASLGLVAVPILVFVVRPATIAVAVVVFRSFVSLLAELIVFVGAPVAVARRRVQISERASQADASKKVGYRVVRAGGREPARRSG
jgi:hypothetical protein